jgi:hypothetical protein
LVERQSGVGVIDADRDVMNSARLHRSQCNPCA